MVWASQDGGSFPSLGNILAASVPMLVNFASECPEPPPHAGTLVARIVVDTSTHTK